ncbi:Serine/threonine-protein phosphatase, partial [Operophtera brumata]
RKSLLKLMKRSRCHRRPIKQLAHCVKNSSARVQVFYGLKLAKLIVTIPKSRHQAPRCARKRRDKKYRKDRSPTMFSLSEGCGCVSFRGGRRARSQGDDSSSCRSSEIEQEVPKTFSRRLLNGKCTMKSLAPLLKFWKRDDVSMTKAER